MHTTPADPTRRRLLRTAAAGLAATASGSIAAAPPDPATAAAIQAQRPPGQPGDFDFLAGEWRIHHRRLTTPGTDEWDEFMGEATCWSILGGIGSVEELRIPERNFAGMGLRLLDVETRVWSDFWVNAKSGKLAAPGMPGHFIDGRGVFVADEVDGETPIKVRGIWDRITPTSCRWHQAVSRDGGATWQENWFMDWRRA